MALALALLSPSCVAVAIRWGTLRRRRLRLLLLRPPGGALGRSSPGVGGHGLQVPEPLALEAPWPDAPLTFAPAGHVPSPTVPGAIVPICPAGLSIVMAPFVWPSAAATRVFLVVPLFGALLVAATYVARRRASARGSALASALLDGVQPGRSSTSSCSR